MCELGIYKMLWRNICIYRNFPVLSIECNCLETLGGSWSRLDNLNVFMIIIIIITIIIITIAVCDQISVTLRWWWSSS